MTDLTHMSGRVPDGQGNPAETDRREAARVSDVHHELAARRYVELLASGDEGGAYRHLNALRHGPEAAIDPWELIEAVGAMALQRSAV